MTLHDNSPDLDDLAAGILAGDRAVMARAITLIESGKPEHQHQARRLLQKLLPATGKAQRIGITGVPGVGKSTLIDQLGMNLIEACHKVAVLAIDPTSARTGGSILGDKTRMNRLGLHAQAFIRPSPTSGTLGGVAKKTRETIAIVEAAGFDIVIVETVGVGQSETAVAAMVDFFLVLLLPGSGDELQGLKKGLIELADLVAINKADGGNESRAESTARDYRAALRIIAPATSGWTPKVATVSAKENRGLEELWAQVEQHARIMRDSGTHAQKRRDQAVSWMHDMLDQRLLNTVLRRRHVAECLKQLERQVRDDGITPALAVEKLMAMTGIED